MDGVAQRVSDQALRGRVHNVANLAVSSGSAALPSAFTAERFGFVDVLRFFAAVAVLIQHMFETATSESLRAITDFSPGVFGVVLFFLVSGFVMPLSVDKGLILRSFAIRRVFRIYPALLFALALWAIVDVLVSGADARALHASPLEWAANILLIQDFVGINAFLGVTWTLILEFAWYGLFALCWLKMGSRSGSVLAAAMPVALMTLLLLSFAIGHRFPMGRIGMIYAAIMGFQSYRAVSGELMPKRLAVDAGLFLLTMSLSNWVAFEYFQHPAITFAQSFWPWILAPLLFFIAIMPQFRRSTIMSNPVLAKLGAISFSIYLLHPIAMTICSAIASDILRISTTSALTLLLASAAYRWVEKPGISLGRSLARQRPRSDIAEEAV